jgi:hypothetical protein
MLCIKMLYLALCAATPTWVAGARFQVYKTRRIKAVSCVSGTRRSVRATSWRT